MQYLPEFGNPNLLTKHSNLSLLSQPMSMSQFVKQSFPLNVFPLNAHQPFLSVFPIQPLFNSQQADLYYNQALLLKPRTNLQAQTQLTKSHLLHMMKVQNSSLQTPTKTPVFSQKGVVFHSQTNNENFHANQFLPELCDSNKSVKAHLKDILYFVLKNFGTCQEEEIKNEMLKYRQNQELVAIFEALLHNYSSTMKTKEEILKHIMKKALKFMKQKMKKETKNPNAALSQQKKSFQAFLEELSSRLENDVEENTNSTHSSSSNKQGSKNDSNSLQIISEAFASEEFYQGFQEYLQTLDKSLELDNNKKIDKFVKFIENSMKRNTSKDVKKYKRVPWLKIWTENMKKFAFELIYSNKSSECYEDRKIVKKEEAFSGLGSFTDETFSTKFEDNQESDI